MKNMSFLFPVFGRIMVFLSLFLCSNSTYSQAPANSPKTTNLAIVSNAVKSELTISFTAASEIYNMLVVVFDNQGNTIFLDNKYRFKGDYKHVIDLKDQAAKDFQVKIINDEEHIKRTLTMR